MVTQTLNKLIALNDAIALINQNRKLIIAGNEDLLDKLPKGNWIGGTIPYFMDVIGGTFTKSEVFVTDFTDYADEIKIKMYSTETIENIVKDRFSLGFSFMLIPGFSEVLVKYAMIAQDLEGIYDDPLLGWVTGIDLAFVGKETPKVFNGSTGSKSGSEAILMHIKLPVNKLAGIEILNIFKQGDGVTLKFLEDGFSHKDCLIKGKKQNLAEFIEKQHIDTKLPLVANYSGATINISFQQVDQEKKTVLFYAPLRKNVEYKLAGKIENYVKDFQAIIPKSTENIIFSCNCILNYLYSELEGKKTGVLTGPITFGEIAYVLVNQTFVYLKIFDV